MAINDIWETRMVCHLVDQVSINIRHWRVKAETPNPASALQVATAVDTAVESRYKDILCTAAQYRGVGARKIWPLPVMAETTVSANSGAGTVAGDPLPTQVCGMLRLRTAFAGHRFRGRMYMPFPSEASNEAATGLPSVAYGALLSAFSVVFVGDLTVTVGAGSVTLESVLWHRATATTTPITSADGRLRWGTQRRRGSYGSKNPVPF